MSFALLWHSATDVKAVMACV